MLQCLLLSKIALLLEGEFNTTMDLPLSSSGTDDALILSVTDSELHNSAHEHQSGSGAGTCVNNTIELDYVFENWGEPKSTMRKVIAHS